MKLYILGNTPKEKGGQLESLARLLLEKREFTNLVVNDISSGGHEIDVRGDRVVASLDQQQVYRVICECKARKSPVDMTDWLKFLGKVYVQYLRQNENYAFLAFALQYIVYVFQKLTTIYCMPLKNIWQNQNWRRY